MEVSFIQRNLSVADPALQAMLGELFSVSLPGRILIGHVTESDPVSYPLLGTNSGGRAGDGRFHLVRGDQVPDDRFRSTLAEVTLRGHVQMTSA